MNDSLGHIAGDAVLCTVAQRITSAIGADDVAMRLGGDEFIVLSTTATPQGAKLLAKQIVSSIARSMSVTHTELFVTCSAGIAGPSGSDETAADPLCRSDRVMYEAKRSGGNQVRIADARRNIREDAGKVQFESELRRAIELNELSAYYEPGVCLLTGQVSSAEALVRWQHRRLGLLTAATFVSVVERNRTIDRHRPLDGLSGLSTGSQMEPVPHRHSLCDAMRLFRQRIQPS